MLCLGEVHSAGYSWLPAYPGLLRLPSSSPEAGQSGALSQPRHSGPATEAAQDARRGQAAAANTVKREVQGEFIIAFLSMSLFPIVFVVVYNSKFEIHEE